MGLLRGRREDPMLRVGFRGWLAYKAALQEGNRTLRRMYADKEQREAYEARVRANHERQLRARPLALRPTN